MRSIETQQGHDQGVEVRKEPRSRALHLNAKLRDAPEWKIEPSFLRSAGFTKRGKRPRQRDMSFISPPPPPLGTAHLTGKVSPPRQSFSRRTDAAAIARQIAREGFRGFLLLCSSLIPWSCGAKPRDGPRRYRYMPLFQPSAEKQRKILLI